MSGGLFDDDRPGASKLPAPPIAADADLRDYPAMLLDVQRLRDSSLAGMEDAEAFRANVLSWCAAWHQLPAGSLPNDDAQLSRLCGYGRDIRRWKKARAAGALWGWYLCSDGRFYHPTVTEKAIAALADKAARKARTQAARAARAGNGSGGPGPNSGQTRSDVLPTHQQAAKTFQNPDQHQNTSTHGTFGVQNPQPIEKTQPHIPVTEIATEPVTNIVTFPVTSHVTGSNRIEGNRIEVSKKERVPPPLRGGHPTEKRGSRLPDGWRPSAAGIAFAAERNLDPEAVLSRFVDYWIAKAGRNAVKVDWDATWRNWCRKDSDTAARSPRAKSEQTSWIDRRLAQWPN